MDVAGGEDAGPARLQEQRAVPVVLGEVIALNVAAGEQEPCVIGSELSVQSKV